MANIIVFICGMYEWQALLSLYVVFMNGEHYCLYMWYVWMANIIVFICSMNEWRTLCIYM